MKISYALQNNSNIYVHVFKQQQTLGVQRALIVKWSTQL